MSWYCLQCGLDHRDKEKITCRKCHAPRQERFPPDKWEEEFGKWQQRAYDRTTRGPWSQQIQRYVVETGNSYSQLAEVEEDMQMDGSAQAVAANTPAAKQPGIDAVKAQKMQQALETLQSCGEGDSPEAKGLHAKLKSLETKPMEQPQDIATKIANVFKARQEVEEHFAARKERDTKHHAKLQEDVQQARKKLSEHEGDSAKREADHAKHLVTLEKTLADLQEKQNQAAASAGVAAQVSPTTAPPPAAPSQTYEHLQQQVREMQQSMMRTDALLAAIPVTEDTKESLGQAALQFKATLGLMAVATKVPDAPLPNAAPLGQQASDMDAEAVAEKRKAEADAETEQAKKVKGKENVLVSA